MWVLGVMGSLFLIIFSSNKLIDINDLYRPGSPIGRSRTHNTLICVIGCRFGISIRRRSGKIKYVSAPCHSVGRML